MKEFNGCQKFGRSVFRASIGLAGAGVIYGFAVAPVAAQNADGDVISLTAGIGVTRDSNILRVSEGTNTRPYGSDSRSDLIVRGNLGISFDRLISQQRLQMSAEVEGFKYKEYDDFDNVGYNAGLNYDWVIGRPFFGRVGGRIYKYQPAVQDRLIARPDAPRNDVERQTLYFNGGMRFTPSWSAIAGWELDRRRNTSFIYEDADTDYNTVEAGGRYAPGTGTEIDLVYRRTKGDYRRTQQIGADGSPLLIAGRNNDFNQDAILARIQYRPSEDSLLAGRIGLTQRNYDFDSSRDFSGVTTGFDVEWAQTGAIQMRAALIRDIQSEELLTASYVDLTTLRLRPSFQLTGKIMLNGVIDVARASYEGDPGIAVSAAQARKDDISVFGVGLGYEYARNIMVNVEARRTQRKSNIGSVEYTANVCRPASRPGSEVRRRQGRIVAAARLTRIRDIVRAVRSGCGRMTGPFGSSSVGWRSLYRGTATLQPSVPPAR